MKVYYEKSGSFNISDATLSFTIIYNNGQTQYAQSPHYHASWELQHFVTDGWNISTEQQTEAVETGAVCIIPPFYFHHFCPQSEDEKYKKISIKFSIDTNEKKSGQASEQLNAALHQINQVTYINNERISSLFSMLSSLPANDYKKETIVSSLVCCIIAYLIDTLENTATDSLPITAERISSKEHHYAISIEDYIASNYKTPQLQLSSLADYLHLSERQTQRLCLKIFKENFSSLLTRQRMTVAHSLIHEKNLHLNEIAEMIGYESYAGFYKSYKKHYNKSPRDK